MTEVDPPKLPRRSELFPEVPTAIGALDERSLRSLVLSKNDAVVARKADIARLADNILQLLPETGTIEGGDPDSLAEEHRVPPQLELLAGDLRSGEQGHARDVSARTREARDESLADDEPCFDGDIPAVDPAELPHRRVRPGRWPRC